METYISSTLNIQTLMTVDFYSPNMTIATIVILLVVVWAFVSFYLYKELRKLRLQQTTYSNESSIQRVEIQRLGESQSISYRELVTSLNSRLKIIQEELTRSSQALQQSSNWIRDKVEEMETKAVAMDGSVGSLKNELSDLERRLISIRDEHLTFVSQMQNAVSDSDSSIKDIKSVFSEFQKNTQDALNNLASDLENNLEDQKRQFEKSESSISNLQESSQKAIELIRVEFENQLKNADEIFTSKLIQLEEKSEALVSQLQVSSLDEIEVLRLDVGRSVSELGLDMETLLTKNIEGLKLDLSQLDKKTEAFHSAFQKTFSKELESLKIEIEGSSSEIKKELQNLLTKNSESLRAELSKLDKKSESLLADIHESSKEEISLVKIETESSISQLRVGFEDLLKKNYQKFTSELVKLDKNHKSLFNELIKSSHEEIGGVRGEIEVSISKLSEGLKKLLIEYKEYTRSELNKLNQEITDISTLSTEYYGVCDISISEAKSRCSAFEEKLALSIANIDKKIVFLNASLDGATQKIALLAYTDDISRNGIYLSKVTVPEIYKKKADHNNTLQKRTSNNNSMIYQSFRRQLSVADIVVLEKQWLPVLDLNMTRPALGYLADRICKMEAVCAGRYATNIEDALLRSLVAKKLAKSGSVKILEIGALFGINLCCLRDACLGLNAHFEATAIDPLDGYYGKDRSDPHTSIPISEEIFKYNLAKGGYLKKNYILIKELSTDPKALKATSSKTYNYLIIDGDHSYKGTKFDFDNYSKLLEPGGYLLFDDYGTPEWPEVKGFVDSEVNGNEEFEWIGSCWRTLLLRKKQ